MPLGTRKPVLAALWHRGQANRQAAKFAKFAKRRFGGGRRETSNLTAPLHRVATLLLSAPLKIKEDLGVLGVLGG